MQPSRQSQHANIAQVDHALSSEGLGLSRTTTSPSIGCNRDRQEWRTHLGLDRGKSIKRLCYMGYWPSVRSRWLDFGQVLSLCVYGLRWSRGQTERGQYPAILIRQAWPIKNLFCGFRRKFSRGIQRVVPSGKNSAILSSRVANYSAGFEPSCPFTASSRKVVVLSFA